MKISVKTLSGETIPLEVQPTDTVLNIKQQIQGIKGFDPTLQKLLRKGALIQDEKTVQELGIQEGDFLVVMVNAKKTAPQPPPVQQAPQPQQQQQQPPPPVQAPVIQPPVQQPVQAPLVQPGNIPGDQDLLSGQAFEQAIQEMKDMGFTEDQAKAAMRAAFNNPERAIEYLLNGIPQVPQVGTQPNVNPPQTSAQTNYNPEAVAIFQQLLNNPQFLQLRTFLQQNPQQAQQIMPQILQLISQQNPELFQLITQNQEAFMSVLLGGGGAPRATQITLTQAEKNSIDNIVAFGFSKHDALEAYLACDKNEEQAINYLYDKQERGDLLSQHIEREQNNPENQPGEGPEDEGPEDDEDDDIYQ